MINYKLKNFIKKFIPKFLLGWYHLMLAHLANFIYGRPSENLIVIGVTGTNGKSTTVNLIAEILREARHKVVVSSTVSFSDGKNEWLNNLKMTMPGRFFLQRLLAQGVRNGAGFAVIESSSEGILQHRQVGLHYDCLVFTNLTPEHLEAHGGFKNYKQSKLKYFETLQNLPHKTIAKQRVPKIIAANIDDRAAAEFLNFSVDQKITYGQAEVANIRGMDLKASERGVAFRVADVDFSLNLKGIFDLYNALAAIAITSRLGIDLSLARHALEKIPNVPGRMELVDEGQAFQVLVDYAYEPAALKQVYATIKNWSEKNIIQILGSTGGGRDQARRPVLGRLAAENANVVILTTDDPYDDDPQTIMDEMAAGSMAQGKLLNQNLYKIPDRRAAMAKAFALAQANDLILITGKGAEQKMAVRGGYIPWDDRTVAREELKKILQK
ncbi:MAG: hypothetical protein A3J07_01065 [Candidatus Doudnabacteria bacterium RIFCSPLOWO2_02_FULL_49_13]|uniref:UDP-N-acetylmuramyl-tripeptide synthetase n=1 Tax=Candidatus Doudnabacteria bacterium RIFCSPHIGHO2_12_FULL_48_16 TaxID=1817838 RepID=A0A1F5PKK2_9BACT|nr:MAG: hypothetical protein A3B77_03995 [Candidatus Doudnabacteria bacterium RIFCSPHIGHO2_02_FULL_49_24]OGE88649.1 MAG: hypothetical protein A2760_01655 [Candidatus Doudnabacteria bacterium RIFCSPHIGHO2_01_FULL_50_67]OGE90334.1 MAG: hypothetical protein A3E29_04575 [Candidatus Doudnabacteria bacterium RIFCSPHIGHO2_12_FULL_48_16]OGE97041.1 MAG: hypothetical protein A2990_01565 [Candidatus Doudnabacteria bacterium RIFCSPLOWO2_01_FULL_49_40]OGF02390.1 MAG: hypothetical protein A3J07_01065 [Candid